MGYKEREVVSGLSIELRKARHEAMTALLEEYYVLVQEEFEDEEVANNICIVLMNFKYAIDEIIRL